MGLGLRPLEIYFGIDFRREILTSKIGPRAGSVKFWADIDDRNFKVSEYLKSDKPLLIRAYLFLLHKTDLWNNLKTFKNGINDWRLRYKFCSIINGDI